MVPSPAVVLGFAGVAVGGLLATVLLSLVLDQRVSIEAEACRAAIESLGPRR